MPRAYHVLHQRLRPSEDFNQPFAQLLPFGWVVVENTFLDGMHFPSSVRVMKTMLFQSVPDENLLYFSTENFTTENLTTWKVFFLQNLS